ncbi:hypothetical protein PVAND_015574 [Polypedilum vanderplanki]|uniref:Uncharacterized protein n=1 Tax=Polypedilum vanderplanki TaxID=319348 RepID=A0A9J6BDI2_POLVA|nr:hypothetical protein PVAND_015574 [Polypedilum vanderplanki]
MTLFRFLIFTLAIDKTITSSQSFGITLDCTYRMSRIPWPIVGAIYECYIESDLFITHSKMPIKEATGDHLSWKNEEKVIGFYVRSAEVIYFPNNLEKIFPNLRLIAIAMSHLREIKQRHLMPFDQLQYLSLFDNDVEVIEKHLFAHNLLLEAIDLRENRILKIHVNVFDYLINLHLLYLSDAFNSSCVSFDANVREEVVRLINELKEECNERAIMRVSIYEKSGNKLANLTIVGGEDSTMVPASGSRLQFKVIFWLFVVCLLIK